MTERKYLPTISDLIDRLSISLMKSIFIDRETYGKEMELLKADIDSVFSEWANKGYAVSPSSMIYAVLVLMLANRYIWENEGHVRRAQGTGDLITVGNQLRLTHSINGVRTRAKNEISKIFGERVDEKIDCLAADLPPEFGNWRVFDDELPDRTTD